MILQSCNFGDSEEQSANDLFSNHQESDDELSMSSYPANSIYSESQVLKFSLTHDYLISVSGTPRIQLTVGSNTVYANYVSGSGTSTLNFEYVIASGDDDSDGIVISPTLDLSGSSLTYSNAGVLYTHDGTITASSLPTTENIKIDTTAPSITLITPPTPKTYYQNENLTFLVTMDEEVDVVGSPTLTLDVGGVNVEASYLLGSGTTSHIYQYNVQASDMDLDGIALSSPISLNGGSLKDAAGNDLDLTFTPLPMITTYIDGDSPFVTSKNLPAYGTYTVGDELLIYINFNETVNVIGGIPSIDITIGSRTVNGIYKSGSGNSTLVFGYNIVLGDQDLDGISIASTIALNGSLLQDSSGNNARLDTSIPLTPGILVDGSQPEIISIAKPNDNTYSTGDSLDFYITFDKTVIVTNTPRLPIDLATGTIYANYVSGSGSDTLRFSYSVTNFDYDGDGISFNGTTLDLNTTGTITDSNFTNINALLDFSSVLPIDMSSVLVYTQVPVKLVISSEPLTSEPNKTINDVIVEVRDASDAVITTSTSTITLAFGTDPSSGSATISGTTSVNAVAGIATFSGLSIDTVNTGYTFDISSIGLVSATSASFDISNPSQVVFGTQPVDAVAGVNITNFTVEIQDALGNLVNTANNTVTLSFASDPSAGAATLSGTLSVAAVAGVATFTNINIDKAYTYTLDASATGLTSDTSSSFTINPTTASKLAFSVEPSNTEYGTVISPSIAVQILDAYDNLTTNTDSITLALNTNPGGSTLSGTLTQAATSGTATFNDISLDQVATGYDLIASATGLSSATSASFDIIATPTQLAITTEPVNAEQNAPMSDIIVEVRDANNNLVTDATNTVTLAFGTDPSSGSASIAGTVSVAAVSGIATFSGLSIDTVNTGYTFSIASTGLTSATSTSFDITTPTPVKLAFGTQPVDAVAGVNITSFTVEIQDAASNVVTASTDTITLSFASDPSAGAATLSGTLSVAAVAGVATFTNINIDKAYTYTLDASATGLTSDTSSSFTINPTTASKLAFSVEPSNTEYGTVISPSIAVQILDAYDNLTTNTDSITLALNTNPGGSTLSGTLTQAATSGTATFNDISLDQVATGYDLIASATGLSSATSASFDIFTPVTLAYQDSSTYDFGNKSIGSSTDLTIVIEHSGSGTASSVSASNPSADFTFKGGAFPGTGGTCGSTVSSNCILVITYSPTTATTNSATLTLSYDDGNTVQNITKSLTGTGTSDPPTKTFVSGSTGIITGDCIPFTIYAYTDENNASNVSSNETINLTVNNGTGTFYSDGTCTTSTSSITINSGSSSQLIYFLTSTTNQNLTLIFNASTLENTSKLVISSNEPVDINVSMPSEIITDECSQFEVSLLDSNGVKTGSASSQTINISASGDEVFYNDSYCTGVISSINFDAYEGTKNIYVKNSTVETDTITFSDNALTLTSAVSSVDFVSTLTWWDLSWLKRNNILVNNIDQAVTFTDMPVLIKISSSNIDYNDFQSDGSDIRFTLDDHLTVLSHNIETWNTSGDSYVWVKIPSITASTELTIFMYYDNSAALDSSSSSSVFTNYDGVWNMDKSGSDYIDSTGSGKDASPIGSITDTSGPIGNSTSFDGSSELDTGYGLEQIIGKTSTLSLWMKTTQVGNNTNWVAPGITGVEEAGGANDIFFGFIRSDGSIAVNSGNTAATASNFIVNDNNWRHVTIQRNETTGEVKFYVNGVLNSTGTSDTGYKSTSFSSFGVIADTGGSPVYYTGEMDSIRLTSSYLDPEIVKAEFKFQANTHITIGNQDSQ